MANFQDLPAEILTTIVGHVCDTRRFQDHFDLNDHNDLVNLRITCRSLCRVATPRLFENVFLDETFLEANHVNALLNFAQRCPHLARHARRLQRRIAPCVDWTTYTPALEWFADPAGDKSAAADVGQETKVITNAYKRRILAILSQPLETLRNENPRSLVIDYDGVERCCLVS